LAARFTVGTRRGPPGQVGDHPGDYQHGQQIDLRQAVAFDQPAQQHGDHHRRDAEEHGLRVDLVAVEHREIHVGQDRGVGIALALHPQRVADLAEGEDQRRRGHEPDDHRLRDVAREVAQLEHGNEDLDDTDEDAQQEQRLEERRAVLRVDECQRAEHQQ
jgi:hypothetical protein